MLKLTPDAIWWNVFFIQLGAGLVGFFSLNNAKHKQLITVGDGAWRWLIGGVVIAIALPWLLWWLFQASGIDQIWVLRGVAIFDLVLLFFLLQCTGGPTESWFTPFLLAITPLGVQLESEEKLGLCYLAGTVYVFATQLYLPKLEGVPFVYWHNQVKPLSHNSGADKSIYHSWYFWSTSIAVFFPTMLGLKLIPMLMVKLGR